MPLVEQPQLEHLLQHQELLQQARQAQRQPLVRPQLLRLQRDQAWWSPSSLAT